ncbi:IS200/IS605 family transposase, partial [Oribacterium sp. NK2B42]|uniref:IS200/IS605 family transposase n=1 Tax=Oribacterium sp. NK2B42 TaxID=689781 RepID=UPI000492AC22
KKMESDKDHIHMLIQYNPTDSISRVASVLKQCSTYNTWHDHEKWLVNHYWKERTLWSDGYFACSIGQVSQATIEHYIENQG